MGDLGLEQFSVSELFSSTLIPGFFLLACILQLHYFHRPFMHITDLEHIPAAGLQPCHIPRPEELHGSRLLRDAVVAESARTEGGESDTASQGTARGGLSLGLGMGWDVLQAEESIRDGFGVSFVPWRVQGWIGLSPELWRSQEDVGWVGVFSEVWRVRGWIGVFSKTKTGTLGYGDELGCLLIFGGYRNGWERPPSQEGARRIQG